MAPMRVDHDGEWVRAPLPFWTPDDGPVYHYTNAAGLIGIVDSNRFWASALLGLNDPTELTYGLERLHEEVAAWTPGVVKDTTLEFLDVGVVEEIKDATFVVCGSSDGDALSGWRGYAGARGYAVEIDPSSMLGAVGADPKRMFRVETTWYKVAYEGGEQRRIIREALQFFEDREALAVPNFLALTFGALASLLKPFAFRDEREIRLIASGLDDDIEQFRAGPFGVLPYIEVATYLPASSEDDPNPGPSAPWPGSLPLKSITCGPGEEYDQEAAVDAARRLAEAKGYPIPVSASTTGFRFS